MPLLGEILALPEAIVGQLHIAVLIASLVGIRISGQSNDGVSLIGARYTLSPTADIGAMNEYGHDAFNTFYPRRGF